MSGMRSAARSRISRRAIGGPRWIECTLRAAILDDLKLGPVEWSLSPPEFIWQPTGSLKAGWRSREEPAMGQIWYGPWASHVMPDFGELTIGCNPALPIIADLVDEFRLRERVADHLNHNVDGIDRC